MPRSSSIYLQNIRRDLDGAQASVDNDLLAGHARVSVAQLAHSLDRPRDGEEWRCPPCKVQESDCAVFKVSLYCASQ